MKTPDFWKKDNLLSFVLLPFSFIYWLVSNLRYRLIAQYEAQIPVICIGNITAGGAGKTPTAIAIAKICIENNIRPCFLSRGYGGSITNPTIVNPEIHNASQVGDEPLLLAKTATTIISRKRKDALQIIDKNNFDIIIMDDGFQNPSIKKDFSILVIDGNFGFGNNKIIPSGPLRESAKSASKKADLIFIIGEDEKQVTSKINHNHIIKAEILPQKHSIKANKYLAFAGIANPQKFFNSLQELNYHIIEEVEFPDHYLYSDADINKLKERAKISNSTLITTEKDYVRLSTRNKKNIAALPIIIKLQNKQIVTDKILGLLRKS